MFPGPERFHFRSAEDISNQEGKDLAKIFALHRWAWLGIHHLLLPQPFVCEA